MIKNLEGLSQANSKFKEGIRPISLTLNHSEYTEVFVAVELKSFGSYIQVVQTKCTDFTMKPQWDEVCCLRLSES